MDKRKTTLLDNFDINQLIKTAKTALENGIFNLKEKYNIKDIILEDNYLLVHYIPKVDNKIAIYSDICQIMAFINGFIGEELKVIKVYSIGVEAVIIGQPSRDNIYIVSTIDVVKEIGRGNIVHWLKNSIVNEPISTQKEVLLLVEGPTEISAYPILFKSMGYPMIAHRIHLYPYSEQNLKSVLSMLIYKEIYFYLVCDIDKSMDIIDLDRAGYFKFGGYHILKNGEFEDYVESDTLVQILEKIDPGIGIDAKYIDENRARGKATSKIIDDYYYRFGNEHVFPGKPILGKEIAQFWAKNNIPLEIRSIILNTMNIA